MSLAASIVLLVVLCAALLGALALVMSRPSGLRRHRPRSGRPPARPRPPGSGPGSGDPGM